MILIVFAPDLCQLVLCLLGGEPSLWATTPRNGEHIAVSSTVLCSIAASNPCML